MESEREWEADEKSESAKRDSEEDDGRGADAIVDGLGDVLGVKNTSWSDPDSSPSSSCPRLERVEAGAGSSERVSVTDSDGDYSGNEISAGLGGGAGKMTHRERMASVASTDAVVVVVVDSDDRVGIEPEQLWLGGMVCTLFDDGGKIRLGGSTEDRLDQRRLGHRRRRRGR